MFERSLTTRRQVLKSGAAMTLGGVALAGGLSAAEAAKVLQWGSSSLGSTGYVIIEALAWASNKYSGLRHSSMSTAGGAENMALLQEGLLDFAQTTSSDWKPAVEGLEPYAGPVAVHQMFAYTVWQLHPMVKADSDVQQFADLAGKRVMPATAAGATAGMWDTVFTVADMKDKVDWTYGSWRESYNALKTGAADVIPTLLTNGRKSPVMEELQAAEKVRAVPVPDDIIAKAQAENPGILRTELAPEDWDGVSKPTPMLSISGILAAHPSVSEEVAYAVTQAVFDHEEEVRSKGAQLNDVSLSFAVENLMAAYPVHPGAAKYFQEKGVWRDDLKVATL